MPRAVPRNREPQTARRVRSLGTRLNEARELVTRLEAHVKMAELRNTLRRMRRGKE